MKPAVMVGARAICGKWGTTTIKGVREPIYCNAKPDHEGQCSYINAAGLLFDIEAGGEQ